MPQPLTLLINSIASFYLLPFLSVGIYAIWAKKYSLANFLLFFGGVNALHSIRLIYQKSVTGYIVWFVAWALILYASYWNNQHEKPYKTENAMLDFLVRIVNGNPFPDKIEDSNKLRAIIALVLTILMIIA